MPNSEPQTQNNIGKQEEGVDKISTGGWELQDIIRNYKPGEIIST